MFESTRLIDNQSCYQLLLCAKGCGEVIATPMKCTPPASTTVAPTTVTTNKSCVCKHNNSVLEQGARLIMKIGTQCEQTLSCPVDCSHVTRSPVRCGGDNAVSTVRPPTAKCTWAGKVFDDVLQIDDCLWVQCVPHANSFAPKLVRSCGNPLTTPEPMTKTTTKFAMWAPWEVHLATGLSLGPDAAKFQRQRVEKVEVENVDPIIASNCLVWAKCMAQERCRYMYNRHCIKN